MAEWFASWFDSPYYPLLYRHRDLAEAERFLTALLKHLAPRPDSTFLDLACGRGRHSLFLHRQGYTVTGVDLSPESISDALQHAAPGLDFRVHDMREPYNAQYDFILNLFTSFGYFQSDDEHLLVLKNISAALKPQGTFVMDFLNADKVAREIVPFQEATTGDIRFEIRKRISEGRVIKEITVHDPAKDAPQHFREEVRLFQRAELTAMIASVGLELRNTWGNYEGVGFDPLTSPRLILFATKP